MNRHTYTGMVGRGEGRATRLSFPTLNIAFVGEDSGVYAAEVEMEGRTFPAVAFANRERGILEAHLLDFKGDLYGKDVAVSLCHKIRDRIQFESDAAISEAITKDAEKAREYFTTLAKRA